MAVTWRKSSRSNGNGGNCVEVAAQPEQVMIRDSKLGDGSPVLAVSRSEWRAFLAAVR